MPNAGSEFPDLTFRTIDSGRYRLLSPLGSGGYGVVYRALERDPRTARTLVRAIKVMPLAPHGTRRAAYQLREAALHGRVSDSGHPHVVRLHRAVRDTQYMYLIMDYLPGGDLYTAMREDCPLVGDTEKLKTVFLKIMDGVAACHARGVFHRDLKPENVLVDEKMERGCVGDFGLATVTEQSMSFNTGTRRYMCPGKYVMRGFWACADRSNSRMPRR